MASSLESQQPTLDGENNHNVTAGVEDETPPITSKVTVLCSGNWGSVAAKLIASNTLKLNSFHDEVRMWVFEEVLSTGEKLSEVINQTNENVKYLPGIKLGKNVVADPDLENAVRDVNMLVFVTPHQFMEGIYKKLVGKIREDAEAISLIKGLEVKKEGPCMISTLISEQLGINSCVLMGANIANEIAVEKFSEATVGYRKNKEIAEKWVQLFNTSYFMVSGPRCGRSRTMWNAEKCGGNCSRICGWVGNGKQYKVGGRNRKCAEAFAKNGGKRSFDELEAEMLQGQKLQGVSTAKEVFPLFSTVHKICIGHLPPSAIVEYSEHTPNFSIVEGSAQFF